MLKEVYGRKKSILNAKNKGLKEEEKFPYRSQQGMIDSKASNSVEGFALSWNFLVPI